MTPQNFCYWLQGYFELTNGSNLSEEQVNLIKEHLQLTFNKVTLGVVGGTTGCSYTTPTDNIGTSDASGKASTC
jgi:hypothetical protein